MSVDTVHPLLQAAAGFAQAHETPWPRDPFAAPAPGQQRWGVHHDDPPPFDRLRGPVSARIGPAGIVRQHGRQLASWGDTGRADLTFSVAKTYLALLAGVAQRQGLLPDEDAPVSARLPGIGFDSPHDSARNSTHDNAHNSANDSNHNNAHNSANDSNHNNAITWTQLLTQTSEWQGSCFGVPDTVDRWRQVAMDLRPPGGPKGGARPLQAPGTYWEYNDVRINQLSLALLHLFGEPLPAVFLREILAPLGGGAGFRWQGYDDAWVDLPGAGRVQSVPGGSHWGGGVSISALDQARIGQLVLDDGVADSGRRIVPARWLAAMAEPCPIAPFCGRLVWLNRALTVFPAASAEALFMVGAGGHLVWIDPPLDAVVVLRWLDPAHAPAVVALIAQALRDTA